MNQWDLIYESPDYRRMISQKTRAVVVMTVFFVVYYFALPVLVGYWPGLMSRRLWGNVTLAYAYAFSQFLMAWAIAYLYMRYAGRFDQTTARILLDASEAAKASQGGK